MNIVGATTTQSSTLGWLGFYLLEAWLIARSMIVGGVAVGLFLGALYFFYYLVRLSRLDHSERQYKQQQHHFQAERLLRYLILIFCILLLNFLFYWYFEFGRESFHTGVAMWLVYGAWWLAKQYFKGSPAKKSL